MQINFRLTGGRDSYEGRVEIFYDGSWGSICAKKPWSIATATAVCRMFGFDAEDFVAFYDDNHFGDLAEEVRFDELDCDNVESITSIKSCRLIKYGTGYCDSGYASVQCDQRKY